MTDAPLAVHEGCGGTLKRVVQAPPIIFNGPGFYVTDSRGKNSAGVTAKQDSDSKPAGSGSESSS
jgi:predicted nucleic acid-binding Zn ribbon protein